MALTLTIAGVDKTSLLRRGDVADEPLSIDDELKARSTATFELVSADGSYRPAVGAIVSIVQDGTTIFGGTIDTIEESVLAFGRSALRHICNCTDYSQIATKRLVARVYESQTAGSIVSDILTNDLSGESVTAGTIDAGPTVTKAIFAYETAAEAFDKLSTLSGHAWWIDYDKALQFRSRDKIAAPFSLTATSANFRNLRVERTREDYRNRQWIRGSVDVTDTITDEGPTPAPDGTSRVYLTKYPISASPTIKVNGSTSGQTIGVLDVDSGKAWYYQQQLNYIIQSTTETILSSTATLSITYQGLFPIALQVENVPEQTSRAAVEGGSGIYENAQDVEIDSASAGIEVANGLLRKYGSIPTKLHFETDTAGLVAGQLLPVNLTAHNLNGTWLVDRVKAVDIGRSDGKLRYEVLALSGEALSGWETFFRQMAAQRKRFVINENQVLVRAQSMTDGITLADTLTTPDSAAARVGTSQVDLCFAG